MNRTLKRFLAVGAATPLLAIAGVGPANAAAIHVTLEEYSGPVFPYSPSGYDLQANCEHPLSETNAMRAQGYDGPLSFQVVLDLEDDGEDYDQDDIANLAVDTSQVNEAGAPKAAGNGGPVVDKIKVEYFDNAVLRRDYPQDGDPENPLVFNEEWNASSFSSKEPSKYDSTTVFKGRDNIGAVRVTVTWKLPDNAIAESNSGRRPKELEFLACSFFLPETYTVPTTPSA